MHPIKKGNLLKTLWQLLVSRDSYKGEKSKMANIFFAGDKQSKQEAINSLTLKISDYFGGRYEVMPFSDDGGALLEVHVEVDDPSNSIASQYGDFPIDEIMPKWNGWRVVILKVPPGYIDAITLGVDTDGY